MIEYTEAIKFHGHNGPFLAIGYRMGKEAVEILKPKGIMDISTVVKLKTQKPYTCVLDGIQCATYCTFGKGNIKVENDEKTIEAVFVDRKDKKLHIKVLPSIIDFAMNCKDLNEAAQEILSKPSAELFEIEVME